MDERGCTSAFVFAIAFVVGTPVVALCFMALNPSGSRDPFGAGAMVGLVVGLLGGVVIAGITTALAMAYMQRR